MFKKILHVMMSPDEPQGTAGSPAAPSAPASPDPAPPAPAEEHLDAGEESPVDWAAEATGVEDDGGEAPAAPLAKPAPAAPAAPVPAPAPAAQPAAPAAPAPAAAAPAAPAPAAAAPVAAPAVQPAAVPAAPAESPEQKAARETAERAATEKGEKDAFDGLVKEYALPDDMQAKLSSEPELVLPFLAAKVHQNVMNQVVGRVVELFNSQLPMMVRSTQALDRSEAESKKAFYDRWPQLAQHEVTVLKAGKMFRELNPSADAKTALEAVGKLVCDSLGIPATPAAVAAAAAAATAAAPASPAFRPAGGGGAPAGGGPQDENLFTQLAEELIVDDGSP